MLQHYISKNKKKQENSEGTDQWLTHKSYKCNSEKKINQAIE